MTPIDAADVVCVGGGLAGLAAAAAAVGSGLDVLVLEAGDTIGGAGAYSGGLLWAPGAPPDSVEAADAYLGYVQGERGSDTGLRRALLESVPPALEAYACRGIEFEVVPGNPDVFYPQAPGSTASGRMMETQLAGSELGENRALLTPSPHYRIGLTHAERHGGQLSPAEVDALLTERAAADHLTMGQGLAGAFMKAAAGARIATGARVTGLSTDGAGAVTGVRLGDQTVSARRGVVLATGGYGWAADAADIEGLPDFAEAGPPTLRGDHLRLGESVGAAVVRGGGPQFSMGARVRPDDTHPGAEAPLVSQLFDVMGLPYNLVVNRAGRRFGDESYYVGINSALARWDADAKAWANFPCWLILDERFRTTYPLATVAAGEPYPDTVMRAPDLRTLAAAAGIDGEALVATVARFNEYAERGEDPDFGRGSKPFVTRRYGDRTHRPNACLGPVAEPPFYALPLRLLGTALSTFGLRVDASARVLRRDGAAVPGLYAAGTAVATTEFRGYVTGYGNTRAITLAHRAICDINRQRGIPSDDH